MNNLMNKDWWIYAGIRSLKTIAQTAIATIATATYLEEVNWIAVASASVLAGILSMLTSLAGIPEVNQIQTTYNEDTEEEMLELSEVENVYDQENETEE